MKKKIKNTIFSLLVAIALILGGNFQLAFMAVNSLKQITFAEYKPTDFISAFEFSSSTGWNTSAFTVSNTTVKDTFGESSTYKNLSSLAQYKPTTNYKGDSTDVQNGSTTDFGSMAIITKDTPTTAEVEKIVDEVVQFKKNEDGSFVYVIDETTGNPKEYPSNSGDTERFVLKEGTDNVYFEKVADTEIVNTYYYYETSSSTSYSPTLKANNWYVLSAYVYADNEKGASIMVTGTNFEKEIKISNTGNKWQRVYLFLESSSDSTNSIKIRFYYGDSEGISTNVNKDAVENGAVYLDHLTFQTINKTDYMQNTIGGDATDEGAIVQSYSARYDYTEELEKINSDFEQVADNGDGTYSFNLYEELYGTDGYDKNADELVNQGYYQYYINKYTDDTGADKLTDKQLGLYHKAYAEKLTTSVVLESKEFETEEEVKDESGNPVQDGNENIKTEIIPALSTFNQSNHILKLANTSEKYSLGILSAPLNINQFSYYKLTVFVKGLSSEDSATIKLISYIKTGTSTEDGAMQVKSQTVSPYKTDSDSTNNWTEVNFYIQGSSYYNTTMQVALLADKESTVYFDEIRLEALTSSIYDNTSIATSSNKFDLFPSSTAITSSITNGNFDLVQIDNVIPEDITKPYAPAKWTKVDNCSKDVVAGIVSSTDEFYLNTLDKDGKSISELLGWAANPIKDIDVNGVTISPARTNCLAMYAPREVDGEDATHDYGYKSSSISLSANSAYKITFEVYFDNTNADSNFYGKIYANLIASDENIAEFTTAVEETIDSDTKGKWVTYTFLVHSGSAARTVYIELGIEDAVGTVFFQKVRYTKLAEKTVDNEKISVDTQFEELRQEYATLNSQNENNVRVVHFEQDPFVMHSNDKVENKDYYETLSHSLKTETNADKETIVSANQGEIGVVDLTETDGLTLSTDPAYNLESSFLSNPKSESNFALVIYNSSNYNSVVTPKNEISLSSSSYYEISLYVKTKDISKSNGLKIYMDKISVTFNDVNTEHNYGELTDSNGYKKFTVYVQTGTSTISGLKISYELGTENNMFTGLALVSDVRVTKLTDADAYNELVENVNKNDPTTIVKSFAITEQADHNHEQADNLTLATFFLVFSSILLVAALVFALVSIYIRRSPSLKASSQKKSNKKNDSDIPKDGFI